MTLVPKPSSHAPKREKNERKHKIKEKITVPMTKTIKTFLPQPAKSRKNERRNSNSDQADSTICLCSRESMSKCVE